MRIAISLLIAAAIAVFYPVQGQSSAQGATIVIVRPAVVFGSAKPSVTVDGSAKTRKLGLLTASTQLSSGALDAYGIASSKPRLSLRPKSGETLYIVNRADPAAAAVTADHAAGTLKKPRAYAPAPAAHGADSGLATIVLLRPQTTLSGSGAAVDGASRKTQSARHALSIDILPGTYDIRTSATGKPAATITVKPGELLYAASDSDADAQKALGDIMFENRQFTAAQARYRRSLRLDSTQVELWRRVADIAIERKQRKDAIVALRKVVALGAADGAAYQALGDLLLQEKRPSEAKEMFEKAMALAGEDAAVLVGLGDAKRRSGDIHGATFAYRKAATLQPDSLRYVRTLGELLFAIGDSVQAVEAYETFLSKGGASSPVAFAVGTYHYRRGRHEDAVKYLLRVKDKSNTTMDYSRMLGESYYNLGEFSKAVTVLRPAANSFTKSSQWPVVCELLIKSYFGLKDEPKAKFWVDKYAASGKRASADIAYYRAFLSERPAPASARAQYDKNTKAHPGDYRNYLRLGMLNASSPATARDAAVQIRKASSLADTAPDAWFDIARAWRQLDKPDDELAALRVFSASQPQHPETNRRIGELMLRKGNTVEAVERLETAAKGGAADASMLTALAKGYMRSGRTDDAIAALEQARQTSATDIEARERLIQLYQSAGRSEKVIELLKEMLEIRRDNSTLFIYARHLHEAGEYAQAIDAIETILATDPEHIDALMLKALALRAQENLDKAIEVYKEISYINPSYVPAMFERAQTHFESSQPMWAELLYQRALKADPKHGRSLLGLARVAKLRGQPALYRQYLTRAQAVAPNDPQVRQESQAVRSSQ